eukprot:gene7950-9780_t
MKRKLETTSSSNNQKNYESPLVDCPVCFKFILKDEIHKHLDTCVLINNNNNETENNNNIGSTQLPSTSSSSSSQFPSYRNKSTDDLNNTTTTATTSTINTSTSSSSTQQISLPPPTTTSSLSLSSLPSSTNTSGGGGKTLPLAEKMRPETFQQFIGQSSILSKDAMLSTLFQNGIFSLTSIILWGPPGCGKTTLAKIISKQSGSHIINLSAVGSGVKELKEQIEVAKKKLLFGTRTVIFVDEIHRYNKLQQDVLLPSVEDGTIILIGATTENPSFELNNSLLSRCPVIKLEKLKPQDIKSILLRAIQLSNQYSNIKLDFEDQAIDALSEISDGDARQALNVIDIAFKSSLYNDDVVEGQPLRIGKKELGKLMQKNHLQNDKFGENHYNLISALHKSIRGSDANAATYWITRMLEGGSDPLYIARRMIRMASEDIGLADPNALQLAVAGYHAAQYVGMPESALNLLHVAVYLAEAPKSNSLEVAYIKTREFLSTHTIPDVPLHICNAPTGLMEKLGYGHGYQYNHDYDDQSQVTQIYLPESIKNQQFFNYKLTCHDNNNTISLTPTPPKYLNNNNNDDDKQNQDTLNPSIDFEFEFT